MINITVIIATCLMYLKTLLVQYLSYNRIKIVLSLTKY